MTYPPVTQLETAAREARADARLADERRAARPRLPDRRRLLARWRPRPAAAPCACPPC